MNHRIREPRPSGPVITVRRAGKNRRARYVHGLELYHGGQRIGRVVYRAAGNPDVTTHHVKAWVELDDAVELRAVPSVD